MALAPGAAELDVAVVFLQAAGSRHRAAERRIEAHASLETLAHGTDEQPFVFEAGAELGVTTGEPRAGEPEVLSGSSCSRPSGSSSAARPVATLGRSRCGSRTRRRLPDRDVAAMDRAGALAPLAALHPRARRPRCGAVRLAARERGPVGAAVRECENVNSWPVLAAADDNAVLGAAILLPDHPQIAAQSKVNMFDNTEIEEALTLHVQSLSDAERAEIEAAGDPGRRGDDRAGRSDDARGDARDARRMKPAELGVPDFPAVERAGGRRR